MTKRGVLEGAFTLLEFGSGLDDRSGGGGR